VRHLLVPLAVGAFLLAGCGGGGSSSGASGAPPGGATMVPADAKAFVRVTTDLGSAQAKQADALLEKFPGRGRLLDAIRSELADSSLDFDKDIAPALGSEADLVALDLKQSDVVALVQSKDPDKLASLLKKGDNAPKVIKKLDGGWVAACDDQALVDRIDAPGPKLADSATFKDATERLPSDALVTAFVDGPSALSGLSGAAGGQVTTSAKLDWIAASLEAQDDGAALKVVVKGDAVKTAGTYSPKLLDSIPSGSLLFASFNGLDKTLGGALGQVGPARALLEQQLGVRLEDLVALLSGEGGLYVREGLPIPEVTLLLDRSSSARKLATLTTLGRKVVSLAGGGATFGTTTIGGQQFTQIRVGGTFSVYFGKSGDHLVVTDSTSAARGSGGGSSLADDPVFKDAKAAAGMPDETAGFVYVNLKDGIPAVERLAGSVIPADVSANLRPLRSLLGYAVPDGDVSTFNLFVQIS
jgi:hypothetical protein